MTRGSIPGGGKRFFSTPIHPDWFWGPPSLLSNGLQGTFSWGLKRLGMYMITHIHVVLRLRMVELYLHSFHTFS
jgi:hypothetical protein